MHLPLKRYWNLLARYMLPQWPRLLGLAAGLFLAIGLRLVVPQIAAHFIDTATVGGSLNSLLIIAAAFCLVGFADLTMGVITLALGSNIGWVASNQLRADLTEHCINLDMAFHHAHTPGEMIERVDGDVRELSNFFSQFAVQLLGNLLLIVGVLLVLLLENWRIGAVFVLFTGIALVVFNRVRNTASPYWQSARQAGGQFYGFLEERLGGIPDIRANGALPYVRRRFAEAARAVFQHSRKAIAMSVIVGNGAELILVLGTIGALAMGVALYTTGAVSIGTVYLITAYAALINRPLREIITQIDDLQKATASIARVQELLEIQPTIRGGRGTQIPHGALAVEFENVSFSYSGELASGQALAEDSQAGEEAGLLDSQRAAPVIHDLSFRLAPGEVLGLIGRTGSGKTTIIRLLLRLYDPAAGRITFNGVDLRDAALAELRGRVGIVTQDVHLFNASLRDNLTVFDPQIPDEIMLGVLRELGLLEWFESLPHGLDTMLEAGGGLSAGEAQLLSVVRVFLRDPGLVLLDEASSRLDPVTERLLGRSLDRLLKGRTAIIIAHHLDTVQRADSILLLDGGRIKEYGRREALAADPQSAFAQLLQLGTEEILQPMAAQ